MFEVVERKRHGLLKSSSNIFQTKRHITISECTPWTDESGFVLVFELDLYLIVSRKTIHERKGFTTCAFIDYPINPRKAITIKAEVEKLLQVVFIYPIQLTQWVSNHVPVNKKQGTIHVCMDVYLNTKKCKFCITSGRLLGFIVLTTGIMVDPLKVEAIV